MKNQILALLFLCFLFAARAQSLCDFQKLINDGKAMAKKENYEMAMYKFNSARRCDPTKGEVVDKEVEKLFRAINRKKKQAEDEKRRAEDEKRRADEERDKALKAQEEAEAQRRRAEAVLDKIYFYDDKFGLAFDKNTYRYGFIDKELNTKIDFRYQEALPFDFNTGYAKVKKDGDRYCLIDTTGSEFLLATDAGGSDPAINALDLRNSNLDDVPKVIFTQTQLKVLFLNNNHLERLPSEISELKNLQSLDISGNQLTALPAQIAELKNLHSLYLSNNQFKSLPAKIAELKNLHLLDLRNNQLTKLPVEIVKLKNLHSLYLSDNQLTTLPAEIAQLKNLKSLNLSRNQLIALPVEIAELKNLKSLAFGYNQITTLPARIAELKNLQLLNLSSNQLGTVPDGIIELINLKSLNLSGNHLTMIPAEIAELKNLQLLNLSSNQLAKLPAEITELKNLKSLEIGFNQLMTFPVEIVELKNLKSLGLSNNQLAKLPAEIAELKNLQELDLYGNQLSVLPAEIRRLNSLKELNLQENPFSEAYIQQLRADMPGCRVEWEPLEIIKIKRATVETGAAATEAFQQGYYALSDSLSQIRIALLRELYAQDSSQYQQALGRAVSNFSFYVCFTDHPAKAIEAGQEAARLLGTTWPRANEGHGYLLTGKWEQAKAIYLSIKETQRNALWQDFKTFARAGIRHPDMVKAAELVLGRALKAEERELLEGKKE